MKLWLLTRNDDDGPTYDAYGGHVIAAPTEQEARALASEQPGDEGRDVWFNPDKVTCEHFGEAIKDEPGTWLSDFHAG